MKQLKYLGYGAATILALVVVISFFLPSSVTVQRSKEIKAPAAVLFAQVNDLSKWQDWDPWSKIDSAMQVTYPEGKTSGTGAVRSWTSNHESVGSGSLSITSSEEGKHIKTALDFGGAGTANGHWTFEESNGITKVTWSMESDVSDPPVIGRYFGLAMDGWLGPDFEKGLENLKSLCEAMPAEKEPETDAATDFSAQIIVLDQPVWTVAASGTCKPSEVSAKLAELYGMLMNFTMEHELQMTGAPLCVYHSYGETVELEAALPVGKAVETFDVNIHPLQLGPGTIATTSHYGPYSALENAHNALASWMESEGYSPIGSPWEVYVTDPGQEPDSNKWRTDLFYPVEAVTP